MDQRTPGTMSTERQRLRIWMRLHSVSATWSPYVLLALAAQLRPMAVGARR